MHEAADRLPVPVVRAALGPIRVHRRLTVQIETWLADGLASSMPNRKKH
jgi:hypothetical protein